MARPLSNDIRIRLVETVEAGDMIRAVGQRFGASPSSVNKIHQRRRAGSVMATPMDGDRRSGSTEAHGPHILVLLEGEQATELHHSKTPGDPGWCFCAACGIRLTVSQSRFWSEGVAAAVTTG